MRKLLSVVLSVSIGLSSIFTVASSVGAESKFKIKEDAGTAERIKAFANIKDLFATKPDLNKVKALYVDKFQTDVKRLDVNIKPEDPKMDENIVMVLDNAIKGSLNSDQAKQAVDKGLQWYFYFNIRDLMNNVVRPAVTKGDKAAATAGFDKIVQIYEGAIQSTVEKRDKKFNLDMVGILKGTIEQLQADIAGGKAADFNVHRQVLDKTIIKTYALATLTYAESIPTKAAADLPAAMTEAYFFFSTIYSYLKGGSAEDADYVLQAFASNDVAKVNKDKIQDAMQRAMIAKVSEYANQTFTKLEAKDLDGARGYAMETNMFVSTQEVFLGAEKYKEAAGYSQKFAEAVDQSDLANARKYSFQVLQLLAGKEGVELKLNDKNYKVDGKAKAAEVAPYLNTESGRTLVPVRLIAEALQAEVSYDEPSKTVKIVKGSKTTELVVGSDEIKQNGKVDEKQKLDQPVVIKEGSSFIPLRAVAELFGKRVFFEQGSIIIIR